MIITLNNNLRIRLRHIEDLIQPLPTNKAFHKEIGIVLYTGEIMSGIFQGVEQGDVILGKTNSTVVLGFNIHNVVGWYYCDTNEDFV